MNEVKLFLAIATRRNEFDQKRNFGTITFDVRVGNLVEKKTVFCYFNEVDSYDEVGPGTFFHKSLKPESKILLIHIHTLYKLCW